MEYKEDVTPGLLEKVQSGFKKNMLKNRKAAAVVKKVEAGKATYRDVDQYAEAVGGALQDAFAATVTSEVLPGGKMHYNIADGLIQHTLEANHEMVAAVAATVQEQLNQSAGIGLKAVSPQLDQEYIDKLKGVATSKETYDDVARMVSTALKTYTQKVADDSVRSNFEFQSKAGLSPKIQRTSFGKCCDWCDSLVGTYDYADVRNTGNDVYRRHARCNCIVEYIPGNGKRQNVWSKRWMDGDRGDRIDRINNTPTGEQRILRIPQLPASSISEKVASGEYSLKLSQQQYDKHIVGTMDYERYLESRKQKGLSQQSVLSISKEEAQDIIYKHSGTGIIKPRKNGTGTNIEWITCEKDIGYYYNKGVPIPTKKAAIHYGKRGAHLVPIRGRNYD